MAAIPLIRPNPPKLSVMQEALRAIEASGVYANNGPSVRLLERRLTAELFGGQGGVVTTSSATLGLILAMKQAMPEPGSRRLALMPSFTFAATAHAAIWAGFKPLLCDIEPAHWTACPDAEEKLLKRHGKRIGLLVPCATFGTPLDLDRYEFLARRHEVGVVVDAAACLGTSLEDGRNFGAGAGFALVYSMHATKTFASGEGGVIYCADRERLAALRSMASFGFAGSRAAVMPGLNAKLSEVASLPALGKLAEIRAVVAHRASLAALYQAELDGFAVQATTAGEQAMQFMSVLLPPPLAERRSEIMASLAAQGIGSGHYFDPHLARQPYFAGRTLAGSLKTTETIATRILTLPLSDRMTEAEVRIVAAALRQACGMVKVREKRPRPWRDSPAPALAVPA